MTTTVKIRDLKLLLTLSALILVMLGIVVGVLLFIVLPSSDTQKASDDRADCRAKISAQRQELRDQRDQLSSDRQDTIARVVILSLSGDRAGAALLGPTLDNQTSMVHEANQAVADLPPFQQVIDKECPRV